MFRKINEGNFKDGRSVSEIQKRAREKVGVYLRLDLNSLGFAFMFRHTRRQESPHARRGSLE